MTIMTMMTMIYYDVCDGGNDVDNGDDGNNADDCQC